MPWCDDCSRFWTPNSMSVDGTCPTCGTRLAEPPEPPRAPWHFKLMVVSVVAYLGWRLWQGVEWVLGRV